MDVGKDAEEIWPRARKPDLAFYFILFILFAFVGGEGGGVAVRACVIIYICQPLAAYVSKCTYTYDQQSTLEEVLF